MFSFSSNQRASLGIGCAVLTVCAAAVQSPAQSATNTVIAFGYGTGMLQAGDQNFYAISTSVELPCVPGVGECNQIYQATPGGVASVFYEFADANNNEANT